jgi:hypothetical protein
MLSVEIQLVEVYRCRFYEIEVDILIIDKKLTNFGKNLFVKRCFFVRFLAYDASFE